MRGEEIEISVVLPAHNEAERIEDAVNQTRKALAEFASSFEIIIAEDGSTDGTAEIASRIEAENSFVKHIHSEERLGRGKALSRAFKLATGEILAYLDVDLSTDMKHLKELINAIKEEHYDFATGSRMLKGSEVKRSFKRAALSKVFNFLVRKILRSKISDHQCGFKSFRKETLIPLLNEITDEHWFWDTEMLVRAQRNSYKIKEIPVRWEDKGGAGTKVNAFKDGLTMFYKIIKLRHFLIKIKT
ncbi:MAG: glycosyltransferase family 2 protein [Methanophagales archaeon]|nr:glycosyltransferase family 2 protein [Methanophagales archaeon]